ncbi:MULTISPECIES: hypothetical protein [unclassified Chamaesiphon]|nr:MULTISPECIES: hypothetical protein [unclassified Chamaesiphon]
MKDTNGAIADYRKAIELYRQQPQQGNAFWAERLTEKVRELTEKK